jgi:hypothetical protein
MKKQPVRRNEAIRRLQDLGFPKEAESLRDWRNEIGTAQGWDGWVRGAFPDLIKAIWGKDE